MALDIGSGSASSDSLTTDDIERVKTIDLEGAGQDTVLTLDDTFDLVIEDNANTDIFAIRESGQTLVTDGSASTPALSFINDTDTGIFRPSANVGGLSAGGVESVAWGTSNFRITNVNLQLNGNIISEVGGTTDASSGAIRLANASVIKWRDSGDANDISVLQLFSDDKVYVGGAANFSGTVLRAGASDLTLESVTQADLTGATRVLITNGSGTALPGTTTDGEIRLFEDTDASGSPDGRIQFQANSTTFTVNADAGITYVDHLAYADAHSNSESQGPDETSCPDCGKKFEEKDYLAQKVDRTRTVKGPEGEYDEVHTIPVCKDCWLDG